MGSLSSSQKKPQPPPLFPLISGSVTPNGSSQPSYESLQLKWGLPLEIPPLEYYGQQHSDCMTLRATRERLHGKKTAWQSPLLQLGIKTLEPILQGAFNFLKNILFYFYLCIWVCTCIYICVPHVYMCA